MLSRYMVIFSHIFHHYVVILLFTSKWTRPDLQIYVAFLCTQVKSPTEQDHIKLGKVIDYLKGAVQIPLVIGTDNSRIQMWNIHASSVIYPNCKSYTGAYLTLEHGSLLLLSSKQNTNTNSSSKAELAGVDNTMTFIISMQHFFELQVRYINIEVKYFHITNRLKAGDNNRIIYKPTKVIESNYFTEALHTKPFHTNKIRLMNACFTRSIKIKVDEIVNIVSPIHNEYIYTYIYIYIYIYMSL